MQGSEFSYKGYGLQPLAAYDDGAYAAMVIMRSPDGIERASDVLCVFPDPVKARQYALHQGMADVDRRQAK